MCAGVVFHQDTVKGVSHEGGSSTLRCTGGQEIGASMVLDATGHSRRLVEFDKPFNPGYQVTNLGIFLGGKGRWYIIINLDAAAGQGCIHGC